MEFLAFLLAIFVFGMTVTGLIATGEYLFVDNYPSTTAFQAGICKMQDGTELLNTNFEYTCIDKERVIFKKTVSDAYNERHDFVYGKK